MLEMETPNAERVGKGRHDEKSDAEIEVKA